MGAIIHNDGRVEIIRDVVGPGDPRLADARDPNPHASTHADGGTDPIITPLDTRAYPIPTGILADRPPFGNVGARYYATDTSDEYLDIGAAWVRVGGIAVVDHADEHADGGDDEITSALDERAYPTRVDTFANRGVPATVGRRFYASDTNDEYIDIGAAWVQPNAPLHAASHQDGGTDEIATTTPGAGDIPKALASGQLDPNWIFSDIVSQGSDATNNSTLAISSTDLVFSFAASSTYLIDLFLIFQSVATTTGITFLWDIDAAVTTLALSFAHVLANTGTLSGGDSINDNVVRGVSSGVAAANVNIPVLAQGLVVTGANSGTCRLKFRTEVNSSQVTFKAGSTMRVMKVA